MTPFVELRSNVRLAYRLWCRLVAQVTGSQDPPDKAIREFTYKQLRWLREWQTAVSALSVRFGASLEERCAVFDEVLLGYQLGALQAVAATTSQTAADMAGGRCDLLKRFVSPEEQFQPLLGLYETEVDEIYITTDPSPFARGGVGVFGAELQKVASGYAGPGLLIKTKTIVVESWEPEEPEDGCIEYDLIGRNIDMGWFWIWLRFPCSKAIVTVWREPDLKPTIPDAEWLNDRTCMLTHNLSRPSSATQLLFAHPHASETGTLCLGEAATAFRAWWGELRIAEAVSLIVSVLREIDPPGAYWYPGRLRGSLYEATSYECAHCGSEGSEPPNSCSACHEDLCEHCEQFYCESCDSSYHDSCVDVQVCRHCDTPVCEHCAGDHSEPLFEVYEEDFESGCLPDSDHSLTFCSSRCQSRYDYDQEAPLVTASEWERLRVEWEEENRNSEDDPEPEEEEEEGPNEMETETADAGDQPDTSEANSGLGGASDGDSDSTAARADLAARGAESSSVEDSLDSVDENPVHAGPVAG